MSFREIPAYGGVANQPRAPKMVISSLLDATESNLEPLVVRTLDHFTQAQAAAGPDLRVTADLYRVGSQRQEKNKNHFLNVALHTGLNLATGLSACFGMDTAGLQLLGMHVDARYGENDTEKQSRIAHKDLPFTDWQGHRTFVVDGGGLSQSHADQGHMPSAAALRENLAANMTQWKSSTHVVHVFGHGEGIGGMASLTPREIGQALNEAKASSGKEADVLLLEACLMGNVESLHQFSGGAKVAVASEQFLEFPIVKGQSEQHLISPEGYARVAQAGGTPREIAGRFLQEAGAQRYSQDTLATFDLKALSGQLVPSLGVFGEHLQSEIKGGGGTLINQALDQTACVDSHLHLLDLGSFLHLLLEKRDQLQPATVQSLQDAQAAVKTSMLEYHAGPGGERDGLTGLSFSDMRVQFNDAQGKILDRGMPAAWAGLGPLLLQSQQPGAPGP